MTLPGRVDKNSGTSFDWCVRLTWEECFTFQAIGSKKMKIQSVRNIAVAAAAFGMLFSGAASAQGVMYVKNNKVGIGVDNPVDKPLHIKSTGTGPGDITSGSGFYVETANVSVPRKWYFTQNAATGAFLISNFAAGGAQFQIFSNSAPGPGGSNPPGTFVVRDGGVGIGTAAPALNTLFVADGKLTSAPAWTARSSKRYKDNIQPLDHALEKVQQLQGVSYNLKSDGQGSIGFIAEDVGQVVPELVPV